MYCADRLRLAELQLLDLEQGAVQVPPRQRGFNRARQAWRLRHLSIHPNLPPRPLPKCSCGPVQVRLPKQRAPAAPPRSPPRAQHSSSGGQNAAQCGLPGGLPQVLGRHPGQVGHGARALAVPRLISGAAKEPAKEMRLAGRVWEGGLAGWGPGGRAGAGLLCRSVAHAAAARCAGCYEFKQECLHFPGCIFGAVVGSQCPTTGSRRQRAGGPLPAGTTTPRCAAA